MTSPTTAFDTFGSDNIFVNSFVNSEMQNDFIYITKAFLKEKYPDILSSPDIVCYANPTVSENTPDKAFSIRILNYTLSMARKGCPYCNALLKYLYKTYYKRQYNTLKKFSHLDTDEILSLVTDDKNGWDYKNMVDYHAPISIILTVCPLFNIELDPDCIMMFSTLKRFVQVSYTFVFPEENEYIWDEKVWNETVSKINDMFETDDELKLYEESLVFADLTYFQGVVFQYLGYPRSYLSDLNAAHSLDSIYTTTLILLEKAFPNRVFTNNDIQFFSFIYRNIIDFCESLDQTDEIIDSIFGIVDMEDIKNSRFNDSSFIATLSNTTKSKAPDHNIPVQNSTVENSIDGGFDLLTENKRLRAKLQEKDQQLKHLSFLYQSIKNDYTAISAENKKYMAEHAELNALREELYLLTDPDLAPNSGISIDEMRACIQSLSITIIGGHSNWINKMKSTFPDWKFIDAKNISTITDAVVKNASYVFFFTDILSHKVYRKYIDMLRASSIPFGYLHSINIEKTISSIYNKTHNRK